MTKFSGGTHYQWQTPPHEELWYNACYVYGRVIDQDGPNYGPHQPANMINTAYLIDMDNLVYAGKYLQTLGSGNNRRHIFWDDKDLKEKRLRVTGKYFLPEPCFDATEPETQWWEESDSDGGGGKKKRKSLKKKSKSKRRKSLKKKQRKTKRKGRR